MAKRTQTAQAVEEVDEFEQHLAADLDVKAQALTTRDQCLGLTIIQTDDQFQEAAKYLQECAKARAVVKAHMDPLCDSAHKAWKITTEKRAELLQPIDQAENHLRNLRADFQRRIAEENRRAQEEAARKQREAEEAAKIAHEKAKKLAAKQGALLPVPPVAPVVPAPVIREVPKTAGIAQTKVWKYEVTNVDALIEAAAKDKSLRNYLIPNDKLIGSNAKVLKDKFAVPGVRVFEDFVDRVRS